MSGTTSSFRLSQRAGAPLQSRQAMLETLVRHLDMIRLTVPALALIVMVGCVGTIGGNKGNAADAGPADPAAVALADFTNSALPAMMVCEGCHQGQNAGVAFLGTAGAAPGDIRTALMGFDPSVVNLDAPQSSQILTKGLHNGPALTTDQATAILTWIQAEKAAADPTMTSTLIETAQFTVQPCNDGSAGSTDCPINTVTLDSLTATGASISFVAQPLGTAIYINELTLNGGANGAYIEHPLFVSHPAGMSALPDTLDRFYDVKQDQAPTTSAQIDGGTAVFEGFSSADQLSIIFKVVSPYVAAGSGSGSGSATTGCKQLASFKTNAQGPMTTNCFSCHGGGNANATAAMDLSNLKATDDPTILLACDQVVTRINLQNIDLSGFFVEPDPGNGTNHNFKFPSAATYTTFHDAVAIWANAEKTSP